MTKIYYACPDMPWPSGGVHTLYRHVQMLRRAGYDAYVLHSQMFFRANWFACDGVKIQYLADKQGPGAGDHLVIPEGMPGMMREYAGSAVRRTVFSQSWSYIFDALGVGESWQQWGIRHVLCVSRYIRDFVKETMGLECVIMHPGIPLPDASRLRAKKRQIAFMPRKNSHEVARIRGIFASLEPENVSVPFVPVDGVRHDAVYSCLQESAIFFASGYPEGCPLPPLEAMACGCLVCGFDGMGMREYVEQGVNGYVVADGDSLGAARRLRECLRAWDDGSAKEIVTAALATAAGFSLERESEVICDYWQRRLADET